MKKIFTLSLLLALSFLTQAQMRYARGALTGGQVAPATSSNTAGIIMVKYNTASKLLDVMGNYRNVGSTVTAAHLHIADFGANGPAILTLRAPGGSDSTLSGSIVLNTAQEADLLANRFYIDLHTTGNPDGEARGQLFVTPEGRTEFLTARLQGAQVSPPNGSLATGVAYVLVDNVNSRFYVTGSYSGLTSAVTGASVRDGVPGSNGAEIFNLVFSSSTSGTINTTKVFSPSDTVRLTSGNIYIDISNSTFPSGEIRGQVTNLGQLMFAAGSLSGAKEVPAVTTNARGTVIVKYNPEVRLLELTGDYQRLSSNISGAHIHGPASTTTNAGVIYQLTHTGGTSGILSASVTITQAQETDLYTGNLYVNVHSVNNPSSGEIRTQLLVTTSGQTEYLNGNMSASQSVATPAVVSSGTGNTTVLLDKVTRKIYVTGSYSNLTSNILNAHLHRGAAGTNGPVFLQLYFPTATTSGTVTGPVDTTISASLVDSITRGLSYLNIHTVNFNGGEIRAQLGNLVLPVKLAYFNGFKDKNTVALVWESAQEVNVKNYEVEQQDPSTGSWIKKGSVNATGGSAAAKYRFDDVPTINSKDFVLYRLKMVDFEGTVSYSPIIRINFQQSKAILNILANPVTNGNLAFTITGISNNINQKAEISIIDFSGRIMHRSVGSTLQNNFVNISNLSTGMYKLLIRTNGAIFQKTFSKL